MRSLRILALLLISSAALGQSVSSGTVKAGNCATAINSISRSSTPGCMPVLPLLNSLQHSDTLPQAIKRGSLMFASGAFPRWTQLQMPAMSSTQVLHGGVEPHWGPISNADLANFLASSNPFTGSNVFTGSNTFSKFNNHIYLDGTKYALSSAGIQAAHDGPDCPASGCIIDVGPNSFNLTSPVTFTKPVCLVGAGIPVTVLTYTPATGIAFNFSPNGFRACFMGIQLTTSTSTSSVGVQYTAVSEGIIFNSMVHGFFGGIRATGDGVSQNSTGIRISQVLVDFNCGSGGYDLSLDHAQDVFIDAFRLYQTGGVAGACGTETGLIIDRSAQGIWMRDGTIENGLHSAVIQNTNLGGNWGGLPGAIFATAVTFDNAIGGTNLLFDSSLGTGPLRFYCNGCWFAGAGQGSSPVSTAMGFDIEGGSDINFVGGVCRFNQSWCGKINSSGTAFEVTEMQVYDNNQGNTAGVGGFLVTANPTNWSVKNLPTCGNKGIDTTGHQHYCVDYSAAASGSGTAYGNNATNNVDGPNNIGAATTGFPAPYFLVDDIFPALSGGVRLSEAKAQIKSKNHAVSGDVVMVAKDGSDDIVQLGDTAGASTAGKLTLAAATASAASLNVASGTAPTTPNAGDIWIDTAEEKHVVATATSGAIKLYDSGGTNAITHTTSGTITSYTVNHPLAAATGVLTGVNASNVITWAHSGDAAHSISQLAKTAAVTTFTLCAATANTACGQAGQYRISYNFYGSGTACATVTAGSVGLNLTWTDTNAVTHTTISLPLWDQKSAAMTNGVFNFNTALGTEGASGSYIISTNGTIIQAATTYVACTSGTGAYNLKMTVEQLQ